MSFENTYTNPTGRTSQGQFIGGLIVLVAAAAFYFFLVKAGRNGEWVMATLLFPALVLYARRLNDMGLTGWLALAPIALGIAAFAQRLGFIKLDGQMATALPLVALGVGAVFALWGAVGKSKA